MLALRHTVKAARPLGVRALATSTLEHAPPLKLHGIPARYASATYTAASKQKQLDVVEKELLAVRAALDKQKAFTAHITNPTVARSAKVKAVEAMLGGKTSTVSKNLLTVLAGNDRLDEVGNIIDAFVQLMKAKRGEVDAMLTTAEPIPQADQDLLSKALAERAGKGKKVLLKTKIDPSLLAGMVVQIGDQIIDMSLASRMGELKRVLTSAPAFDFSAKA